MLAAGRAAKLIRVKAGLGHRADDRRHHMGDLQ
jgi:hypothetical protein